MTLPSSTDNIRYNGTGRGFFAEVGGASLYDLGEFETLGFNQNVTSDKMKSNRNADRSDILEVETARESTLSVALREQSIENLQVALVANAATADNQSAGDLDASAVAVVADHYTDMDVLDPFVTKLTGVTTGTVAVGDTVTGAISGATGVVAWKTATLLELITVTGTFQSGEKAEVDVSNYLTISGIEIADDVVVCDAATPTARYVLGTDYNLDIQYGLIRKVTGGAMGATVYVSCQYAAVSKSVLHALSASSVTKKFIFVTDADDQGPRIRYTFWKVKINLNGDLNLIGDGASLLSLTGTVLKDTTRATGQQFYMVEYIG